MRQVAQTPTSESWDRSPGAHRTFPEHRQHPCTWQMQQGRHVLGGVAANLESAVPPWTADGQTPAPMGRLRPRPWAGNRIFARNGLGLGYDADSPHLQHAREQTDEALTGLTGGLLAMPEPPVEAIGLGLRSLLTLRGAIPRAVIPKTAGGANERRPAPSAVEASAEAGRGGIGPVRVGQAGEDAVRRVFEIGDKIPIRSGPARGFVTG